jgi:hypothetical protein
VANTKPYLVTLEGSSQLLGSAREPTVMTSNDCDRYAEPLGSGGSGMSERGPGFVCCIPCDRRHGDEVQRLA